jgi:hypothetical protein
VSQARGIGRSDRLLGRARSGAALRAYGVFVAALLLLFIADGSRQPTSGAGWRILGYQRGVAGPAAIVPVTTQADLDVIWDRMLIRTAPARLPADASTFWVTATGSFGCPAHFAGFEVAAARITAIFTSALTTGCDRLQVPDSFLVSIDDGRLPAGAFQFARTGPAGQPDAVLDVKP